MVSFHLVSYETPEFPQFTNNCGESGELVRIYFVYTRPMLLLVF